MEFPTAGLTPKTECGIADLLAKSNKYDGRGIVVAIFDTGCDVNAEGLRVTSEGKPKFIDSIDTTGSGDVDCSLIVTPNSNNEIIGLTGRVLKINPEWVNPTQKYYLGIKQLKDIAPATVKTNEQNERTQRYDHQVTMYTNSITSEMAVLASLHGDAAEDAEGKLQIEALKYRLDLFNKYIATTKDVGPVFDCLVWHDGEHYVAVIDKFENGDFTTKQTIPMHDFALQQQHDTFSYATQFTYSFKIYCQDPKHIVLSIVVASGTHGTHVAGLTGAFYSEDHPSNSSAPGVQLISVKIGDSLISTMETSSGLCRAFLESVYKRCDIVNISYGEQTITPNMGAIQEYANLVATKYGVFVISSAGNAGPCLTTCGAPGATSEHVIGVAAVLAPNMMQPLYGMNQKSLDTPTNYHWSSRGPSKDGGMLSISGLGAGQMPVPRYTSTRSQLMNGTSMSSPAVSSLYAALLSALKQKKYKYTISRVRHAVEQSATILPRTSPFAQGNGLMHVGNAFDYFEKIMDDEAFDIHYKLRVSDSLSGTNKNRGIYIREPNCLESHRFMVNISPQFPQYQYQLDQVKLAVKQDDHTRVDLTQADNNLNYVQTTQEPLCNFKHFGQDEKLQFQRSLNFRIREADGVTETAVENHPFIIMANCVTITNMAKDVPILIDMPKLAAAKGPGAHYFALQAYIPVNEPNIKDKYPNSINKTLFTLPITVIVPEQSDLERFVSKKGQALSPPEHQYTFDLDITPHEPGSVWIQTPSKSSYAIVKITARDEIDVERMLWFSTQIVEPYDHDMSDFSTVRLTSKSQNTTQFGTQVIPDRMMEIVITHPWTSSGEGTKINLQVTFHGVSINHTVGPRATISLPSAQTYLPVVFNSLSITQTPVEPTIIFSHGRLSLRPNKVSFYQLAARYNGTQASSVDPVARDPADRDQFYDRNILPHETSMHAGVFEFTFTLKEKVTNGTFEFSPACGYLYESQFHSQNAYIYNKNGELIHVTDAFPDRRTMTYEPGSYTAQVYLKHPNLSVLQRLKNVNAVFTGDLPKKINIPVISEIQGAWEATPPKLKATILHPCHTIAGIVNIGELQDQHVKDSHFDVLTGVFTPYKDAKPKYLFGLENTKVGCRVEYNVVNKEHQNSKVNVVECDAATKGCSYQTPLPNAMIDFITKGGKDIKCLGVVNYLYKEPKKADDKLDGEKKGDAATPDEKKEVVQTLEEKKEDGAETPDEKKEEESEVEEDSTNFSSPKQRQLTPMAIITRASKDLVQKVNELYKDEDPEMFEFTFPQIMQSCDKLSNTTKPKFIMNYYTTIILPLAHRVYVDFSKTPANPKTHHRILHLIHILINTLALLVNNTHKADITPEVTAFVQEQITTTLSPLLNVDKMTMQLGLWCRQRLSSPISLAPPVLTAEQQAAAKKEEQANETNAQKLDSILVANNKIHILQLILYYNDYAADSQNAEKLAKFTQYLQTYGSEMVLSLHAQKQPKPASPTKEGPKKKPAPPPTSSPATSEEKDKAKKLHDAFGTLLSVFEAVITILHNPTLSKELKYTLFIKKMNDLTAFQCNEDPEHKKSAQKFQAFVVDVYNLIITNVFDEIKAYFISEAERCDSVTTTDAQSDEERADITKIENKNHHAIAIQLKNVVLDKKDSNALKNTFIELFALHYNWYNITQYRVDATKRKILNRFQPFF